MTPRFHADVPSLAHHLYHLTGHDYDVSFALWLLFRTWASDGNQRRGDAPNHIDYEEALVVFKVASRWKERAVVRHLKRLVKYGFATLGTHLGRKVIYWRSPSKVREHLLRVCSEHGLDKTARKIAWLARRGSRYAQADQRRTFLAEIVSFRSRADLRARLSQMIRLDSAFVRMGRTKQATLLGCSRRTIQQRVAAQRTNDSHERVSPTWYRIGYPASTPEEITTLLRNKATADQLHREGTLPHASTRVMQTRLGHLVLVRQAPSRSSNRRVFAFSGDQHARQFGALRRTLDLTTSTDGFAPVPYQTTSATPREAGGLESTTAESMTGRAPARRKQKRSRIDQRRYFPLPNLQRYLHQRGAIARVGFIDLDDKTVTYAHTAARANKLLRRGYQPFVVPYELDRPTLQVVNQLTVRHGQNDTWTTTGYFRKYSRLQAPKKLAAWFSEQEAQRPRRIVSFLDFLPHRASGRTIESLVSGGLRIKSRRRRSSQSSGHNQEG